MSFISIDSFSISLDNSLLTVAFTTDIDTETYPFELWISSDDGSSYSLESGGITTSPYEFSNRAYAIGTKLEVYLYDNTGTTIESNRVKLTVPIRFDSMEFIKSGLDNLLDSYYTYGGQVNPVRFWYSQDSGVTYTYTNSDITSSPYSLNSNSYPSIFVAGTVYAYFFDETANVSSPVSTATFTPPPPPPSAILNLTSLAFETSGGSNVLDIQYTASNISSAISFYYSQDNGATFNVVSGNPNIYPSPYYLNSNTYPTLFSNGTLFTGYLFNSSSNVSSGFVSTTYYKVAIDLKEYFYTATGGSNVLNLRYDVQNISSPTYFYYRYETDTSYTQLTEPISSLSTYLLSNAYPSLFSTGQRTYGFIRDDIDSISSGISSAIFFQQAISFDRFFYEQFLTSNTLNVFYSTTQIANPLHFYYSQDAGATYTTLAGDPLISTSPVFLTSNAYPTLFSNNSNISAYLIDTIDIVSSAISTTTFTFVPTIYFNTMAFIIFGGSNFLSNSYTYEGQTNSLTFYYSQDGGVTYNNTGTSIDNSPYLINSNGFPSLFVNGTVYAYFYDSVAGISSAVSTATFEGPSIRFSICTITYGYDTIQNTDTLTATFFDQYNQTPFYTNYSWLINGTLAATAPSAGIVPIVLYSNGFPSYFTRGTTFCNTISNPSCNNVTTNFIDFTNPNFTITNAYSTNINTLYANLNYTYPFSTSTFSWSFTTSSSNFIFHYSTVGQRYPTQYPLSTILSNAYFTAGQSFSNLVSDTYGHSTSQLTFVYPKFTIDSVSQTIAPSSVNLSYSYVGLPSTSFYSIQADTVGGTLYSKNNIASNVNPIGFDQPTYPDLFTNGRSTFFTMYNTTTPEAGSLSTLPFLYVYPLSLEFQISSITLDPQFTTMNVFFLDQRNQASVYYKLYINGNYTNVFNTNSNIRQLTLSNTSIETNPFFAPGCNQNYIYDSTNQISTQIFNFSVPSFYFQLSNVSLTNNLANLSVITTYYQNNNGAGLYPSSFQLYVNSTFTQSISTTTSRPNNFLITKTNSNQNLFIAGSTSIYQVNAITSTELLQSTNTILFTTPSSIFISSIELTPDNTRIVTYFETNFSSPNYFEKFNSEIYESNVSSPIVLSSINAPALFEQYTPLATQITNNTESVISPTSNYILTAEISTFSIASLFFDTYYSSLTVSWIYALKNSNIGLTNLKYAWYMQSNTPTITPFASNITGTSTARVTKHQIINEETFATPAEFFVGGANWSTYITAYSDASLAAGFSNNTPEVGQLVSSYFYINTITVPDNNTMNFNFVYNISDYDRDFTLYINNTETTRGVYPTLTIQKSVMPPGISYPQFFSQGFNGNARIFNSFSGARPPVNTATVNYYLVQAADDTSLLLPSTNASEITFITAGVPSKSVMLPPADCNAGKVLHFKYYNVETSATRVTITPNIPGLTATTPSYVTFSTPYTSMIDGSANSLVNFGVTLCNNMQSNAALSLLCDGVNWYTINQYKGDMIRGSANPVPDLTAYEPYGNQVSFYDMKDKYLIQLADFGDCFLKFLVIRNSSATDKFVQIYTPSTSISTFGAEGYQNFQNFYQLPNSNQIKVNETYSFMFSYIPSTNYESIFCLGYANLTSTLQASSDYSLTAKSMASTICMSSNFSTFQTISSAKSSNFGNLYIYKNTNVSTSSFFIQTPTSNSSFFLLGSTNYTINTITNTNTKDRQSAFWMFTTYSTNTLHTINIPVMYYTYNPIITQSGGGSNSNSN